MGFSVGVHSAQVDKKLGRASSARVVAIAAKKTSNEKNDVGPEALAS
ncbi:hypothetical protein [Rhodococcus sp. SMB37]|nr:hypothetical protein [Rhodococcus sp. SMB37]